MSHKQSLTRIVTLQHRHLAIPTQQLSLVPHFVENWTNEKVTKTSDIPVSVFSMKMYIKKTA